MVLGSGMLVAFLVSVFVIKFLMGYIKKHDFKVFGWYRIVLGIVVLGYAIIIHDIAKFVNIFFIIFLTMPSFCVIVLLSKGGNNN